MPARSEAQRRYLNMKFGHAWTKRHGYDNKGKLPSHIKQREDGKRTKQEEMVRRFQRRRRHGRAQR